MSFPGVYVDEPQKYPREAIARKARGCGDEWSHMWCDPGCEEELHRAATALGQRRDWFQDRRGFPHYDLTKGKYWQARRHGVALGNLREWVKKQMQGRGEVA